MQANTPPPQLSLFQTILNTITIVFRRLKDTFKGRNDFDLSISDISSISTSTSSINILPPSEIYNFNTPPTYQRVVTLVGIENSVFEEIRETKGQERPKTLQEPQ